MGIVNEYLEQDISAKAFPTIQIFNSFSFWKNGNGDPLNDVTTYDKALTPSARWYHLFYARERLNRLMFYCNLYN